MKNKTRIPLLEPDLGENELKYLSKCISDNWISSAGPFIEEFEKKIATYAECEFSVATANATSGLYLSLIVATEVHSHLPQQHVYIKVIICLQ